MWENLPAVDVVYTERQYWQGALPKALPYDRELAGRLLDDAGWRDLDDDGVRERDGSQFRFSLMVDSEWQAAAVYVQAQLRQVGIRMDITIVEGRAAGEGSPLRYRNARVIKLLGAAQKSRNPDETDEIFRGLMSVFGEDMPFTSLVLSVETYVVHRRSRA